MITQLKNVIPLPPKPVTEVASTPRIWCQKICLSMINFDPNYLRTGKTEWAKKPA